MSAPIDDDELMGLLAESPFPILIGHRRLWRRQRRRPGERPLDLDGLRCGQRPRLVAGERRGLEREQLE
jgi:hypothetical protein